MSEEEDWAVKLARQWINAVGTGKPLKADDSVFTPKVSIDWHDDSLKRYYNKFWFKFDCCKSFDDFLIINEYWLQNRIVHGTFHDFMYLLKDFDFNRELLQKEYDTAFGILQMALRWQDIQDSKDIFKKLKFSIVIDGYTTIEERKLHDVVLEIDDPLLDVLYPPNHFNDRTTIQVSRSYRLSKNIDIPKVETKFRNNVGKYFVIDAKDFFAVPKSDENLEIVRRYWNY